MALSASLTNSSELISRSIEWHQRFISVADFVREKPSGSYFPTKTAYLRGGGSDKMVLDRDAHGPELRLHVGEVAFR